MIPCSAVMLVRPIARQFVRHPIASMCYNVSPVLAILHMLFTDIEPEVVDDFYVYWCLVFPCEMGLFVAWNGHEIIYSLSDFSLTTASKSCHNTDFPPSLLCSGCLLPVFASEFCESSRNLQTGFRKEPSDGQVGGNGVTSDGFKHLDPRPVA